MSVGGFLLNRLVSRKRASVRPGTAFEKLQAENPHVGFRELTIMHERVPIDRGWRPAGTLMPHFRAPLP